MEASSNSKESDKRQRYISPGLNELLQLGFWLLFLGLLLPLTMATALPDVVLFLLMLLMAPAVIWIVVILHRGINIISTPLDIGIFFLVIALVLSAIFSIDPSRSWPAVWNWIALIILFYMTVTAFRLGASAGAFSKSIIGIGALYALFGFIQLAVWLLNWYEMTGWPGPLPSQILRISGLLNNPNHLPAILNVSLMIAIVARLQSRKRSSSIILSLFIAATIIALLLTRSRAGWLSTFAGLTVIAVGYSWLLTDRPKRARRSAWKLVLFIVVLFLTVIGSIFLLRPETLKITSSSQYAFRIFYWRLAADIWQEHPITGSGLNTYVSSYLMAATVPFRPIFREAHSLLMNTLAEMGLVGIAALLVLAGQFIVSIWKSFALKESWSLLSIGILASISALVINSFFDTPTVQGLILLALLTGVLISRLYTWDWAVNLSPKSRSWLPIYVIPAVIVLLITGVVGWRVSKSYAAGLNSAGNGNWNAAASLFQEAGAESLVDNAATSLALGFSLGVLAEEDVGNLEPAIAAYELGVKLEPGWSVNFANLAALYWQIGRQYDALDAMQMAIDLAPDVPVYHLNLGLWLLEMGENETSSQTMQKLFDLPRTPKQSPLWYNQSDVLDQTQIDMAVDVSPGSLADGYSMIINDPEGALAIFQEILNRKPVDARAYVASAIAHLYRDDKQAALKALNQAELRASGELSYIISLWQNAIAADSLSDDFFTGIHFAPYSGVTGAGLSESYSVNAYSRYAISDLFLPQLICFTRSPEADQNLSLLEEWSARYVSTDDATSSRTDSGLTSCLKSKNE